MNNIKLSLIQGMTNNNLRACNIIVNSEYFMYRGKRVFCEIDKSESNSLNFFVYASKTSTLDELKRYFNGGFRALKDKLESTELFGASLPIVLHAGNFSFKMIPSLGVAIIETELYRAARAIAEHQLQAQRNGTVFNWNTISVESTQEISLQEYGAFMDNFWEKSRRAYRNIIYQSNSTRYVKQLYRSNEFYKIMDAFIPIFIDCDLFFNPTMDDSILQTNMYKLAVEKGRYVSVGTNDYELSGYFLTQEEICKAFNMRHFMRFTPQFWYDIFMGLLYTTGNNEFPSVNKKVMRGPQGVTAYGIPRVMTISDYLEKRETAEAASIFVDAPVTFNNVDTPAEEFLKILNSYHETDSLYIACESIRNAVVRSGAYALDDKGQTRVENIYQIMLEAKL